MAILGVAYVVVSFAAHFGCAMHLLVNWSQKVARVNERLPPGQRFDSGVWTPDKRYALDREYRRLFPGRPLDRRQYVAVAIMVTNAAIFVLFLYGGLWR